LINNAGMFIRKALIDTTEEDYDRLFPLNAQDIADVVAFVVSDEARWLTGQNIHAGGGMVM
jgi:NAD(P)-dependent dehydrogenase (short-subunit alcohol dehydrogenase family)